MDVEAIAKKLTPAQREAIVALDPFGACRRPVNEIQGPYRGISKRTLQSLLDRGLVHAKENYHSRFVGLLQSGLAVRDYLIKEGK